MATLRGQAARQWIAQNPNRGFTDLRTGQVYGGQTQQTTPQRSGIENLILGLSKPFRQGAGIAQEFGYTINDLLNQARGDYEKVGERPEGGWLMSDEETQALREDPIKAGLKSGIGVASYGLGGAPKGGYTAATTIGRMGQAGLRNLPAGLAGGFGYSEEGDELGSTLKGGAIGFGTGALLQGASEIPEAIRNRGAKMQESATNKLDLIRQQDNELLNAQMKKISTLDDQIANTQKLSGAGIDDTYYRELLEQVNSGNIEGLDDILPYTTSTRKSMYMPSKEFDAIKAKITSEMADNFGATSADEIFNNWADLKAVKFQDKSRILSELGEQAVDSTSLRTGLKKIDKIVGQENVLSKALNDGLEEIFGKGITIDKIPKTATVSQVNAVRELADQLGGGAEKLLAADTSTQISGQLLNKVRDSARDISSGVEPLDNILDEITNLYKFDNIINEAPLVAEQTATRAAEQSARQMGLLGQRSAKEATRMSEKAASLAQRNQRYVNTLAQKRANAIQEFMELQNKLGIQNQFTVGLGGIMPVQTPNIPIGGDVRAPLAGIKQGVGQRMANLPQGVDRAVGLGSRIGQYAIPAVVGLGSTGIGQPSEQQYQQAYMPIQQAQQQSPFSRDELAQMVLNGQISASDANFLLKLYAPEEVEDQDLIMNVQDAISMLDQGGGVAGKVPTALGKAGEFFGAAGRGTDYRALISDIRTRIINQIAGTAQTPQEMKNLIDRLPKSTDEPAVAKRKLKVLLESLSRGSGATMQAESIADQYQY